MCHALTRGDLLCLNEDNSKLPAGSCHSSPAQAPRRKPGRLSSTTLTAENDPNCVINNSVVSYCCNLCTM